MSTKTRWQSRKAPIFSRCCAFCIDYSCGVYCYSFFKDSYKDGQGLGKSLMGLRVVDYNTGRAISKTQGCMRNICQCCWCLACFGEGRRLGDYIAGTIVISDK